MKKINLYPIILIILFSCQKKGKYFISKSMEDEVFRTIDSLSMHSSNKDKYFYVLCRYDSLIIMSSQYSNIIYPTDRIKEYAIIVSKNKEIILTEPYKPFYNIFTEEVKKEVIQKTLPSYYSGDDYQRGVIYKIKDLNHLAVIDKGDLRKYFYRIKEYELPPPPK